jgi:hypothetical protein
VLPESFGHGQIHSVAGHLEDGVVQVLVADERNAGADEIVLR